MQTAGNLIPSVTEFTAGMQYSHNYFYCRFACLMHINRNTVAVIHNGDTVIRINGNLYGIAKTRQRFINTVIYNFRYQMMQTAAGNTANIHTGAFPYRFQSF